MPSTYAHYTFGEKVLDYVNDDVKNMILENKPLYQIGLHGPDIFFYYKPYCKNKVNQTGQQLHRDTADLFFNNARERLKICKKREPVIAYLLGFICHFMLDSECHYYITEEQMNLSFSHHEIENEFERYLMNIDGKMPFVYKPTSHLIISNDNAEYLSCLFHKFKSKHIKKSIDSMRFFLDFNATKDPIRRTLIKGIFKLTFHYKSLGGLLMNLQENQVLNNCNKKLFELYQNAVVPTASLMNEYLSNIDSYNPLNHRFSKNFK